MNLWKHKLRGTLLKSVLVQRNLELFVDQDKDVTPVERNESVSYDEVLKSSESEWLKAMKSEMDSTYDNQVWNLVDPPEGIKPIGCKWVFKKKTDMEGNVITYKARLVEKDVIKSKELNLMKLFLQWRCLNPLGFCLLLPLIIIMRLGKWM